MDVLSALLVALSVAPPPSVWVAERKSDDPRCTGEALAQAIRTLLPDADVRVGTPTQPTDLQVALTESPKGYSLSLSGGPAPFTRALPENGSGQCAEAVNLSALIISRDLDELPWRAAAPPPLAETTERAVPPPPGEPSTRFVVDVGAVATRIAGGISPGLTLDLGLVAGPVFALLGGDLLLAQHPPIGSGIEGTWVIQSYPVRLVGGVSLRLGPGDASFGLGGGALFTSVSVQSSALFHIQSSSAVEGFACVTVGYALPLPWHLLAALRFEERWVPSPTRFFVFAAPETSEPVVQTPTFAGALSLLIGREFF